MSGRIKGTRILIVEDEKVVADTLGQILSGTGYEIRVVYSAEDALALLATWRPEIAILDVMLPKMNGIELALVLKEHLPSCHTLLFSGQPSVEALMEKAKNEGHHFEILAKPVHPTVMLDAISTLLCTESRCGSARA
jgi:DNA-binding NtrC family response regulator